jgi:hypothetical protein
VMENPSAEQVARDGTGKTADADKEDIGRAHSARIVMLQEDLPSRVRLRPAAPSGVRIPSARG